jgi:DNA gyrase subunit A
VLIRTRVAEIREMGRATQGVTLIALDDGTRLSGLQRVVETDVEHPVGNGSAGNGGAGAPPEVAGDPGPPADEPAGNG